jgi:hypothetical protein
MRKTVRLTERDLSRIVRRVMNEGAYAPWDFKDSKGQVISIGCMTDTSSIIIFRNKSFTMTPDQFKTFCGSSNEIK